MLMGELELYNIRKHLKIRMRECSGIRVLCNLLCIMFAIDFVSILKELFHYQADVKLYTSVVYSDYGLYLTLIAAIYYMFKYGEYNENHQIFPQSCSTRFLSFELYCYLIHIITQITALGLYLLQYLLCRIFNYFKGNLRLAYSINIPFIITGFLISLFYGFLILSFLFLIGYLIRKFRWLVLIAYLAVFLILWFTKDQHIMKAILHFYLKEPYLLLFFIKIIGTWLILEFINQKLYSRNDIIPEKKFIYPNIVIASVILLSFLFNIFKSYSYVDISVKASINNINKIAFSKQDKPDCTVDAGKLSANSLLSLDYCKELKHRTHFYFDYPPYNDTENEIRIYYSPEKRIQDNIDLTSFINPEIKASLNDNKLAVCFVYTKNIKIVSLYPYSTLMQFNCFKDKNYAKSSSGCMMYDEPGVMKITFPKNKNFIFR